MGAAPSKDPGFTGTDVEIGQAHVKHFATFPLRNGTTNVKFEYTWTDNPHGGKSYTSQVSTCFGYLPPNPADPEPITGVTCSPVLNGTRWAFQYDVLEVNRGVLYLGANFLSLNGKPSVVLRHFNNETDFCGQKYIGSPSFDIGAIELPA